ncbi:ABC transporter permease [Thiospirochaeta perfilievii]|uniref:ABC transporter permease n=1 Tax=Thiospirochaeta perfilievii TaxID=252967 RepID=A0A5C1QB99_9SPIO|nr:ABC transporter permease [Thiospirochaeta perfilievii]QEN05403.1 ABC transporter permease [Thiospirochaeta perfilievii]
MNPEIEISALLLMLLLLLPIIAINTVIQLKINKELMVSTVRMILQLIFVGVYLQFIFTLNHPFINLLYLLVMIIIASMHSIKSSSLKLRPLFLPILISVALPQLIILIIFNLLIAGVDNLFEAKFIIPVGGMLLGNCLNGNIIALNSFYEGIKDDEKRYNYTIVLGASHNQALLPYLRKSIKRAINPTLASMATIGLVSLPGMMTGQILAGALPITAIKYQIAIMLAIFSAKYFSIILSLTISRRRGFTPFNTLNKEIFLNR